MKKKLTRLIALLFLAITVLWTEVQGQGNFYVLVLNKADNALVILDFTCEVNRAISRSINALSLHSSKAMASR